MWKICMLYKIKFWGSLLLKSTLNSKTLICFTVQMHTWNFSEIAFFVNLCWKIAKIVLVCTITVTQQKFEGCIVIRVNHWLFGKCQKVCTSTGIWWNRMRLGMHRQYHYQVYMFLSWVQSLNSKSVTCVTVVFMKGTSQDSMFILGWIKTGSYRCCHGWKPRTKTKSAEKYSRLTLSNLVLECLG